MQFSPRLLTRLLASVAVVSAAGCAVGPDFHRPEAPAIQNYTGTPLPDATTSADIVGGAAQRFLQGEDVPGQWWTLFKSDPMTSLVNEALAANPDLASAEATLEQAQETARATEGAYFPQVDARYSAAREGRGPGSGVPAFDLFNASVGISYVLDVFGGVRRGVEATDAQADNTRFQMEATYTSLVSNVMTTAIRVASTQAQIAATQDIITAESQSLNLLNQQFELGAVAKGDVLAQQSELAQIQASLPPLQKQLAQFQFQLAQLLGRFPGTAMPTLDLNTLFLPTDLPVSLPSKLIDQRPDVRAAEANLHVASANVGVATANMLPQFTLSASYGSPAPGIGDAGAVFNNANLLWSLAGGVTQPIFHGGTLLARRRAAEDAYDAAAAHYRSVALSAFQDVANTLRAMQLDAETLRVQLYAEQTSSQSLDIVQERFKAGAVSYLSLLDAERTYQQARILLIQAQANRYADTVALFVALGGGWWNRDDMGIAAQDKNNNPSPTPAPQPISTDAVVTPAPEQKP
jgi:NodT family efflux transporter outer membrane factor (OMF) lipoprotein